MDFADFANQMSGLVDAGQPAYIAGAVAAPPNNTKCLVLIVSSTLPKGPSAVIPCWQLGRGCIAIQ